MDWLDHTFMGAPYSQLSVPVHFTPALTLSVSNYSEKLEKKHGS